jgi:hypothetical protein
MSMSVGTYERRVMKEYEGAYCGSFSFVVVAAAVRTGLSIDVRPNISWGIKLDEILGAEGSMRDSRRHHTLTINTTTTLRRPTPTKLWIRTRIRTNATYRISAHSDVLVYYDRFG